MDGLSERSVCHGWANLSIMANDTICSATSNTFQINCRQHYDKNVKLQEINIHAPPINQLMPRFPSYTVVRKDCFSLGIAFVHFTSACKHQRPPSSSLFPKFFSTTTPYFLDYIISHRGVFLYLFSISLCALEN